MDGQLTDEEYEQLVLDDELYFECCLQIRTKDRGLQPLKLNASQRYAHQKIEEMRAELGYVRVVIVKGRQQGVSTYVGGRFYKRVSTSRGVLAMIVTHEDAATQNLFGMTKRYHENNLPDLKPSTSTANANELRFDVLDSGYKIATAGARSAGRSNTIQYLHASEFDFWPEASADEVWKGLLEAVPANGSGTEVIIESTADKPGGRLHRMVKAAQAGDSNFRLIFIPWFVHEEYASACPMDFDFPEAFETYQEIHQISDNQLYWAYCKNRDMAAFLGVTPDEFCISFKREYPATAEEAFEAAGDDLSRVFPSDWIKLAQRRWENNKGQQLPAMTGLGADVAQGGPDKSVCAPWHGVRAEPLHTLPGSITTDGPQMAGMILSCRRDDAVIAIDVTGGWGGSALTHAKDHLDLPAIGVNSSEGSTGRSRQAKLPYKNKRTELHWDFRDALDPVNGDNVELPPDDELEEEMLAATFEVTPGGILILAKDKMKEVLGRSPDKLDALLLGWYAAGKYATRHLLTDTKKNRSKAIRHKVIHQRAKVTGRR